MKGTALVTGCAGFIGSHLVERLLAMGYTVIGIDNFRTGRRENISKSLEKPNFEFIEEDITSPSFIDSITETLDVVFHLAAIASVAFSTRDPLLVNRYNVEGTLNVLEMARRQHAKRLVFASSAAVYGDPDTLPVKEEFPLKSLSPYAASKIAGEYYVQAYGNSFGLEYVILRFFNVYGPRQDESEYSGVIGIFASRAVQGLPLKIEGDGLQTRSFIHVRDVIEAIVQSGERDTAKNQIMNVSGEDAVSIIELAQKISKITGAEIVHEAPRIGDIQHSIGDTSRIKEVLGATTPVPLTEGLRDTLQWYRQRFSD
ncbi:MAG: NAD-dependent epimerase/dehydratase family protein [Candidatus Thorarchaeota archaeon]